MQYMHYKEGEMTMDNFEGGSPMRNSGVSQHPAFQSQQITIPRSEEVILSHETETPIVDYPEVTPENRQPDTREVADKLLADSKTIGIGEVFKKLSTGAYRQNTIEQSDVSTRENDQVQEYGSALGDAEEGPEMSEPNKEDPSFNERNQEVISYISEQVHADPLMKQMLGEVASEMIASGEEIDPHILQEEALARYIAKKEEGNTQTLEGKVESIEEQFAELLKENDDLRKELTEFKALVKQQSETMNAMALALLEMAKKLHKEKEDEKEKTTLLELLIHLMGLLLQEMISGQHDKNKKEEKNQDTPKINVDLSKVIALMPKKKTEEPQHRPAA